MKDDKDYNYQTIKIWKSTLSDLRLLSGVREEPMVCILNQVIKQALAHALEKYNEQG